MHSAALSNKLLYSSISVIRCRNDKGSLKLHGIATRDKSLPMLFFSMFLMTSKFTASFGRGGIWVRRCTGFLFASFNVFKSLALTSVDVLDTIELREFWCLIEQFSTLVMRLTDERTEKCDTVSKKSSFFDASESCLIKVFLELATENCASFIGC